MLATKPMAVLTTEQIEDTDAVLAHKFAKAVQEVASDANPWLIARHTSDGVDSAEVLSHLYGIQTTASRAHPLFYTAISVPQGWKKVTYGFWTDFKDESGVVRFQQFFDGIPGKELAYINIVS